MPQTTDTKPEPDERSRPMVVDAKELKERVKQINSLSTLTKDETLRMRLKHVG